MIRICRYVLLACYFVVAALVGALGCLLRPFNPDNSRLAAKMFSAVGLKILGIDLKTEGKERFQDMAPGVVVSNHQSNLDLFVHGANVPRNTVSVGKRSLIYIPFFGQVYWLAGNIMIDRNNSKKSIGKMDAVTQAIKEKGTSIWVFAEGTRNKIPGLAPFKKGAFHMAIQAQAPIYPVVASTYKRRLDFSKWRSGNARIKIMEPIPTLGLSIDDLDELMARVHALMEQTLADLDQRIAQLA